MRRARALMSVVLLAGCADPTQLVFDITTDVPCDEVGGVGLAVGPAGTVEARELSTITRSCQPDGTLHAVGTYAVVPEPPGSAFPIGVRVMLAARGASVERDCTAEASYAGCIVSRRVVSFVPHKTLVVPIELLLVCEGVACDANSTCDRLGRCVPSTVSSCEADSCALPAEDGGDLPANAHFSTWTASPDQVPADGRSQATLTLELRDARGAPVPRQVVSIASSVRGVWAVPTSMTDDAGRFVASLSSDVPGASVVSARVGALSLSTRVLFMALDGGGSGDGGSGDGGSGDGGSDDGGSDGGPGTPLAARQLSAAPGSSHLCAVTTTGEARCWGSNFSGELGVGTFDHSAFAVPVVAPWTMALSQLVALQNATCARTTDGEHWCWGSTFAFGDAGGMATTPVSLGVIAELMQGDSLAKREADGGLIGPEWTDTAMITRVLPAATSVTIGFKYGCLVTTARTVACWGFNDEALLTPEDGGVELIAIARLEDVVLVRAGFAHTCALHGDAGVSCWGRSPMLGLGIAHDGGHGPWHVPLGAATGLGVGFRRTCVVLADGGTVACWRSGESPTAVALPGAATTVEVNNNVACSTLDDASVWCWGNNWYGGLGSGDFLPAGTVESPPVRVMAQ